MSGTPPLNHPDRGLFEQYTKRDDTLIQTSLANDNRLAILRRALEENPKTDLSTELSQLAYLAQTALEKSEREQTGSWNDHYRLITQTAFLKERLFVPVLFSDPSLRKAREEIMDGVYGISGKILSEQLADFECASTKTEAEELRGAIQEQTFIALINREQDGVHFALPADTSDDLIRHTDAILWQATKETLSRVPIQVKSSFNHEHRVPTGGTIITSGIMHNTGNTFRVSRLVVRELDGESLTEHEDMMLRSAREHILSKTNRARGSNNVGALGALLRRIDF